MRPIDVLPLKEENKIYKLPHRKQHDPSSPHTVHCYIDKPVCDFAEIMDCVGFKLRYVKSGAYGHTFHASSLDGKTQVAIKIVPYCKGKRSLDDIDDPKNPVNVEILMLRLLSQYVTNERCPHIVAPIITFNTPIHSFIDYISNNNFHYFDKNAKVSKPLSEQSSYKEFLLKQKKGYYHDTLSVLISEWADRGDFLEYLQANYLEFTETTWKVLFFQIVAMLACIQQNFPNFKHNDLKANNILIKSNHASNRFKCYKYCIYNRYYLIPNIGISIKFWDFDFSSIESVIDNAKLEFKWAKDLGISSVANRYADLHYFFNSLIHFFDPLKKKNDSIPESVFAFINRIIPSDKVLRCRTKEEVHESNKKVIEEVPRTWFDHASQKWITTIQKKEVVKKVKEVRKKPTFRMESLTLEYMSPEMLLKTDEFFQEFRVKQ